MSFKPGDLAVVILVPGASCPGDVQPGAIVTIVGQCGCAFAMLQLQPYWLIDAPSRRLCAAESTLRKINGEDRQVVRWDQVPWQPQRERMPA